MPSSDTGSEERKARTCPTCGLIFDATVKFCPEDGSKLSIEFGTTANVLRVRGDSAKSASGDAAARKANSGEMSARKANSGDSAARKAVTGETAGRNASSGDTGDRTASGAANQATGTVRTKTSEPGRDISKEKTLQLSERISTSSPESLVGFVLDDQYEILSVIGQGGMSVVYKARHMMMHKVVAVKTLLPHLMMHPASIERFRQEAQAASNLSHPNIVTVHNYGLGANSQPYIVMDFLEGQSLAEVIRSNGALPIERACHIFVQIADALSVAHKNKVVHRDLKPSNILLVPHADDRDFVKIVDFGIAKLLPTEGAEVAQLTQTGELFGSPLYMSPEQSKGDALDAKSDIYSLGCLMYETIAGKPPLDGDNTLEILYKHVNEIPDTFHSRGVKVPNRLETIIFKAMAKDPAQRHASMGVLRDNLMELMQDRKTPFFTRLFSRWELFLLRRKPRSMADRLKVIAATASIFIVVLAASWVALLQTIILRSDAYKVDYQWAEDAPVKAETPPASAALELVALNERAQAMKTHPDKMTPENVEELATGLQTFGREMANRHCWDLACDATEEAVRVNATYHGEKTLPTFMAHVEHADILRRRGNVGAALEEYEHVFPLIAPLVRDDLFSFSSILRRLADAEYAYAVSEDQNGMTGSAVRNYSAARNKYAELWSLYQRWPVMKHGPSSTRVKLDAIAGDFIMVLSRLADCEGRLAQACPNGSAQQIGMLQSARAHYGTAEGLWRTGSEINHQNEAVAQCKLADVEHALVLAIRASGTQPGGTARYDESAQRDYVRAIDLVGKAFPPSSAYNALVLRRYAGFLADTSNYLQSFIERNQSWILYFTAK